MPSAASPAVGTLGEKPLHASLKRLYTGAGDRVEVTVEGFVVDIVHGKELIEIQTGSFSHLRRKLTALLPRYRVRVVHPVAVRRQIVRMDADGTVLSCRMSPKKGAITDVFAELVSLADLVAHPGFTLEVVLVADEELRRHEPAKAWRRRGWVVVEHRLVEVVDKVVIDSPVAFATLLPDSVPETFTSVDLATALRRPRRLAQQMTYCLRRLGLIEVVAKRGNTLVYSRVSQ
jgi:hypothetical protein